MNESTPAGWYTDPDGSGQLRYWDGSNWTDSYHQSSPAEPPTKSSNTTKWVLIAVAVVAGLVAIGAITGNESTSDQTSSSTSSNDSSSSSGSSDSSGSSGSSGSDRDSSSGDEYVSDSAIAEVALEIAWDGMSRSDRDSLCTGYYIDPDMMWRAFSDGADGTITKSDFNSFMATKC